MEASRDVGHLWRPYAVAAAAAGTTKKSPLFSYFVFSVLVCHSIALSPSLFASHFCYRESNTNLADNRRHR